MPNYLKRGATDLTPVAATVKSLVPTTLLASDHHTATTETDALVVPMPALASNQIVRVRAHLRLYNGHSAAGGNFLLRARSSQDAGLLASATRAMPAAFGFYAAGVVEILLSNLANTFTTLSVHMNFSHDVMSPSSGDMVSTTYSSNVGGSVLVAGTPQAANLRMTYQLPSGALSNQISARLMGYTAEVLG